MSGEVWYVTQLIRYIINNIFLSSGTTSVNNIKNDDCINLNEMDMDMCMRTFETGKITKHGAENTVKNINDFETFVSWIQILKLKWCFIETHDLDIDEDDDRDVTTSCGGHSSNGMVDVDSGNSSSHSPSPDDTFHSINTQKCQNNRPSNGHSHCLSETETSLKRPTSFSTGKAFWMSLNLKALCLHLVGNISREHLVFNEIE